MKYYIPFLLNGGLLLFTYPFIGAQSGSGLAVLGAIFIVITIGFLLNIVLGIFYLVRGERKLGAIYLTIVFGFCLLFFSTSVNGKLVNG
ncbi:hypothetical protein D0T11_02195 [Hymenobacter rubripertinctus]|uniref:Uncharacterized protein n=1 Tax=Hymenobacter rubripertinctus TaxID=2029981 RepID=A0A418R708_9BACT|nr:hypothetical protein D0T11_02195 [Hymenobacter rubripertinctus]